MLVEAICNVHRRPNRAKVPAGSQELATLMCAGRIIKVHKYSAGKNEKKSTIVYALLICVAYDNDKPI